MVGPTPITEQEVVEMRARIYTALVEAKKRADISGKPLLILVGEQHNAPQCVILEAMIYSEAKKLGIKDFTFEGSQTDRAYLDKASITRTDNSGTTATYLLSAYAKDNQHLIDDLHDAIEKKLESDPLNYDINQDFNDKLEVDARNKNMAGNLSKINRPVMAVVGNSHVEGMLQYLRASKTYEIAAFDVTPALDFSSTPIEFGTFLKPKQSTQPTSLKSADPTATKPADPTASIGCSFKGDTKSLTVKQLFDYGLGEDAAKGFLAWAAKEGHIIPFDKIEKMHQNALKFVGKDIDSEFVRMVGLYESGEDKEAGKQFALWMTDVEKTLQGLSPEERAKKIQKNTFGQYFSDGQVKAVFSFEFKEALKEELSHLRAIDKNPQNNTVTSPAIQK